MKIASIVLSSLTILMVLSQLICGLWMQSQAVIDPSSVTFHARLGISTVVIALITVIVMLIYVIKH
ncbi:MAG: hypothetical protein EHM21_16415 [Chloroflexi bacterium]|nr:MAG: hypothetical protein EHM21_16415 [Chloroflexota bacterium]